ncbi:FMRFamide-activated amiloride-sensitive sodium channel [Schistosoma japonicum]|nr:FMRFamide-activated amiloride-sensitive sodium channel [Schistosoma japonicum]
MQIAIPHTIAKRSVGYLTTHKKTYLRILDAHEFDSLYVIVAISQTVTKRLIGLISMRIFCTEYYTITQTCDTNSQIIKHNNSNTGDLISCSRNIESSFVENGVIGFILFLSIKYIGTLYISIQNNNSEAVYSSCDGIYYVYGNKYGNHFFNLRTALLGLRQIGIIAIQSTFMHLNSLEKKKYKVKDYEYVVDIYTVDAFNDNNDNVNIVQINDQHSIIDKSILNCYHFNQMKQSNKKVNKINIMEIICDTFSIRGVARLRSRSAFLRGLWLCFVLIMTIGLLLTTYLLVQDYLLYDVSVNIHVALDTKSPFPALTICHHQPFSQNAYNLWRNNDVMSPSIFNKYMRNLTHTFLIDNDVDTAETLYQYDSLSIYYQNIKAIDAYRLGHDTTVFLNCMRRVNQTMQIEDNCMHMDGFQIRKFSHHIYFNCHTFEPKTKIDAYDTDTIALIVSLGIDVNYDNQHEQAFLVAVDYHLYPEINKKCITFELKVEIEKPVVLIEVDVNNYTFNKNYVTMKKVRKYSESRQSFFKKKNSKPQTITQEQ